MPPQLIVGFSLSFSVTFDSHEEVLPAASVTVKVTVCIAPCTKPKAVPAVGDCVLVCTPQLSDATRSPSMFGTAPLQSPSPLLDVTAYTGVGQLLMNGRSRSSTVTVKEQVVLLFAASVTVKPTWVVPNENSWPLTGPKFCVKV